MQIVEQQRLKLVSTTRFTAQIIAVCEHPGHCKLVRYAVWDGSEHLTTREASVSRDESDIEHALYEFLLACERTCGEVHGLQESALETP